VIVVCDHCSKLCWCNPCFYIRDGKVCPRCHHFTGVSKASVKRVVEIDVD